jgi:hypothetical protein
MEDNYISLFVILMIFAICAYCLSCAYVAYQPDSTQQTNITTTILSKEVLPSDGFSINRIHTTSGDFDINSAYVTNEMFISLPIGEPIKIYVRNGIVVGYSINKTGGL